MQIKDHLAKLNRLRANAGKPELKSWKSSKDSLLDAIYNLEQLGFVDVVPGAKIDVEPITEDPEVKEALAKEPPVTTKVKPGLSRGLGDEPYARNCRKSVQDIRAKEKAEAKLKKLRSGEVELDERDQQQIKNEAELRRGEVDPKKDPKKAARQKKHIEEKRAKRKAEGKSPSKRQIKDGEISVADIARELGISPKIARNKLRRHEDKLLKLHTKGQDRWVFPKSAAAEIKKILK
jgi:hypothetical protein